MEYSLLLPLVTLISSVRAYRASQGQGYHMVPAIYRTNYAYNVPFISYHPFEVLWTNLGLRVTFPTESRQLQLGRVFDTLPRVSMKISDILIRPLTSADVPKVRELHSSLLPITYPLSFFTQLLILPARVCLVAYHPLISDHPVAFITATCRESPCAANALKISSNNVADAQTPQLTALLHATPERPHIEILTLGVLPAYQKQGLARLLVSRVHQYFRESSGHFNEGTLVQANVSTSNVPALTFYERIGMRISSDVIRNLYRSCSYGSRDGYLVVGRLT